MDSAPPNVMSQHKNEPELTARALRDITFGSVAGMVSKVIEHPFDLCKVRLQSQVLDATARFKGPLDCLTYTWRNEGIAGLYRGLPPPVFGAMVENACLFFAYSELQTVVGRFSGKHATELSLPQLALAAAGAGAITSTILTPIELVKCKMQVQMLTPAVAFAGVGGTAAVNPPGVFAIISAVLRTQGVRGMWLGHSGTLIRETGGSAAWFSTKEAIASALIARRRKLDPSEPSSPLAWESAVAGAGAGCAYNLALFPADTVKSTVQTAEELRPSAEGVPRPTYFGTAREMWRHGGIRGLYAGCGITIARSIPSSAIVFVLYDGLKSRFG